MWGVTLGISALTLPHSHLWSKTNIFNLKNPVFSQTYWVAIRFWLGDRFLSFSKRFRITLFLCYPWTQDIDSMLSHSPLLVFIRKLGGRSGIGNQDKCPVCLLRFPWLSSLSCLAPHLFQVAFYIRAEMKCNNLEHGLWFSERPTRSLDDRTVAQLAIGDGDPPLSPLRTAQSCSFSPQTSQKNPTVPSEHACLTTWCDQVALVTTTVNLGLSSWGLKKLAKCLEKGTEMLILSSPKSQ